MPKIFLKRFLLLLFVVLGLVLGSFSWYLLSAWFSSELSYRRHVSFLNFEQAGYRLRDSLTRNYAWGQAQAEAPAGFLLLKGKPQVVAGTFSADLLPMLKPELSQQVLQIAGQQVLVRRWETSESFVWQNQTFPAGVYGVVWPLRADSLQMIDVPFSGQVWLLNLQGQLLMANDPQLRIAELLRRSLVQNFIQAPVNRFQIPVETEDKHGAFGFAMLIPETNLVLFAEIPLNIWVSPILKTFGKAVLGLVLGLFFLSILTRSYVLSLREQVQGIAKILENFSGGYFIPPDLSDLKVFHELEPIHSAVSYSTKRVRQKLNELEREVQTGDQA